MGWVKGSDRNFEAARTSRTHKEVQQRIESDIRWRLKRPESSNVMTRGWVSGGQGCYCLTRGSTGSPPYTVNLSDTRRGGPSPAKIPAACVITEAADGVGSMPRDHARFRGKKRVNEAVSDPSRCRVVPRALCCHTG